MDCWVCNVFYVVVYLLLIVFCVQVFLVVVLVMFLVSGDVENRLGGYGFWLSGCYFIIDWDFCWWSYVLV